MKADLIERYAANLHGVLSCFDRILITGTLPGACYARGMTSFLNANGIRIFDYARFAEPLRERIRGRSQEVCAAAGTSKAECTDAVVTLKMQTDLAHRRESVYGYRAAAHPVCQNTRKLAQTGRVHLNAHDQEGPDENPESNPSARRRAVLFDGYVSSPYHFGSARQDSLNATEPARLYVA